MPTPFQSQTLYDSLGAFGGGVNEGDTPLDLPPDVMAGAINTTVSGKNVTHRPAFIKRFSRNILPVPELQWFQGASYFLRDDKSAGLLASIGAGGLFRYEVSGNSVTEYQVPITANVPANYPNGYISVEPQAWLWQNEYTVIVQDGKNNPLFFDTRSNTATQSTYFPPVNLSAVTTADFIIPAVGSSVVINFNAVTGASLVNPGDIITVAVFGGSPPGSQIQSYGTYQVLSISVLAVTCVNLTSTPVGADVPTAASLSWIHQGTQLPPGRMGTYGLGRNWFALPDGKQFVASDIVGGSSGTQANGFRDAPLNITENLFIVGGGNFTVPGNVGDIRAMKFVATLDVSLGQGPLQVFTPNTVFSCQAPVDRLTWQSVTNPILTESLISNGALSQDSTQLVNGDVLFRSIDGVRSLILARRDFDTWGNVPISFEVSPILDLDDVGLLGYTSAVVFDNRYLLTTNGIKNPNGVYFNGIVPINFDPISSLRGKAPAVWDSGVWSGITVLKLVTGQFDGVQRCFAFVLNTNPNPVNPGVNLLEIWEILPQAGPNSALFDNDGTKDIPIIWQFDSASMRFGVDKRDRKYMSLSNGELWIDELVGTVTFEVRYRPDQYPCWSLWRNFTTCQTADIPAPVNPLMPQFGVLISQPGFIPRLGIGEPSPALCDTATNRPMRNGFTFQVRHIIQGHCVFLGSFYEAVSQPMPKWAPIVCAPLCPQ